MNETAAPDDESAEIAGLVETNSEILAQIRDDLSREYTRFMSRLLRERLALAQGSDASALKILGDARSSPGEKSGPSQA